jgi:hypothetical protein
MEAQSTPRCGTEEEARKSEYLRYLPLQTLLDATLDLAQYCHDNCLNYRTVYAASS